MKISTITTATAIIIWSSFCLVPCCAGIWPFPQLREIPKRLACFSAYNDLEFELTRFELYDTYFRDDSVMVLPQTGTYQGANAIEEYVSFTSPNSAYLADSVVLESSTRSGGYNFETGQCIFDLALRRRFTPNPRNTAGVAAFDGLSMAKLFYDLDEGYITRINLYFPEGLVRYVFEVLLNSDNTWSYLCNDVLATACSGIVPLEANCEVNMANLPVVGPGAYVDGDQSGCRALHGAFATINPARHCAHVSLSTSDVDDLGEVKCNESENIPLDLFSEDDLDFFADFSRDNGDEDPLNNGLFAPAPSDYEPTEEDIFDTVRDLLELVFGGLF